MKFKLLIILLLNGVFARSNAQGLNVLKPGDKVPDLRLNVQVGDSVFHKNLSDYKGKSIILDFWGVDCSDCITSMPQMLDLQQRFNTKIQIILVTKNSKEDVKKLMLKLRNQASNPIFYAGTHLPFVLSDTILNKIFPHYGNPIHIWIDSSGVYKAIAYENTTTADNVQSFIDGKVVDFASYTYNLRANRLDSCLDRILEIKKKLLNFSLITKYNESFMGQHDIAERDSTTAKIIGVGFFNKSIAELYSEAFYNELGIKHSDKYILIRSNLPLFHVKDPQLYIAPKFSDKNHFSWIAKNSYCYISKIAPSAKSENIYRIMRDNLDSNLGLKSTIENLKTECWVLKRKSNVNNFKSVGGEPSMQLKMEKDDQKLIIRNQPMWLLFSEICGEYISRSQSPYFLNETNYKGNIDIEIPSNAYDVIHPIAELQKSLRKYGLDLVEEYRNLNVLVVRNKAMN